MRIILLHAPPWKITDKSETPFREEDGGPPAGADSGGLAGDFLIAPFGLLSLAAQSIRAGHDVQVLNLSAHPWRTITEVIRLTPADIFGVSCFTINRRGVAALAQLIRTIHPRAHIVVGGPHVTPMPTETLNFWPEVDTVVVGEGEETFSELINCLAAKQPTAGIAGTAWRNDHGGVTIGPRRPRLTNLDALAAPQHFFPSHTVITSRGCPGNCTFCASNTMWGKILQFHSVDYVLDILETCVKHHGLSGLAIKDDTFTASKKRVLAICEGIQKRQLNFAWSCDTRADSLNEEILAAMRRAGCQRLSFGVESASPEMLKMMKKRITPETVLATTDLAKKFGFEIRYYMIAGNRGETWETFQHNLNFLKEAKPHQFSFSALSFYPGTEDFSQFQHLKNVTQDIFFTQNFTALMGFVDVRPSDTERILNWLGLYRENREFWQYSVAECEDILKRMPDVSASYMDLAGACFRAGLLDRAEENACRALEMDYPLKGLAYNLLACITTAKGDSIEVELNLDRALEFYPHPMILAHAVFNNNKKKFQNWQKNGGPERKEPLQLQAYCNFEPTPLVQQPEFPAAIHLKRPHAQS